jgi:hypothetical protein
MKNVFNDSGNILPEAREIVSSIDSNIYTGLKIFIEKGYRLRDIESLMHDAVGLQGAILRLEARAKTLEK